MCPSYMVVLQPSGLLKITLHCCFNRSPCVPMPSFPMQLTALQAFAKSAKGDLAAVRADAAGAAQRCAELQAEQAALAAAKAALEEQLAARQAAAEEMDATLTALKEDCARLDSLNSELREAMDRKVRREQDTGRRGLPAPIKICFSCVL